MKRSTLDKVLSLIVLLVGVGIMTLDPHPPQMAMYSAIAMVIGGMFGLGLSQALGPILDQLEKGLFPTFGQPSPQPSLQPSPASPSTNLLGPVGVTNTGD